MPAEFREHRRFIEDHIVNNTEIQHQQIQVDNLALHYHSRGEANKGVVLWIHGTPGSWSEIGQLFVDHEFLADYRFVSIDRPGWGDSQFEPENNSVLKAAELRTSAVSLAAQANAISPLISLLKQQYPTSPLLLAGHSWGASLLPVLAADNLHAVDGALLFAGGIAPDLTQPRWYHRLAKYWPVSVLIGSELAHSNNEMLALPVSLSDFESRWEELDSLPVIVVQGGQDPLVDPKNIDFAAEKLSAASHHRLIFREDLGHLLHMTQTQMIVRCIRAMTDQRWQQCH